jgi:hypothetical protein
VFEQTVRIPIREFGIGEIGNPFADFRLDLIGGEAEIQPHALHALVLEFECTPRSRRQVGRFSAASMRVSAAWNWPAVTSSVTALRPRLPDSTAGMPDANASAGSASNATHASNAAHRTEDRNPWF